MAPRPDAAGVTGKVARRDGREVRENRQVERGTCKAVRPLRPCRSQAKGFDEDEMDFSRRLLEREVCKQKSPDSLEPCVH
jgi:hypothetical protein